MRSKENGVIVQHQIFILWFCFRNYDYHKNKSFFHQTTESRKEADEVDLINTLVM